ncbi:MAG: hypothetical protein R2771_13570 [Saprospiraceae bacterium]
MKLGDPERPYSPVNSLRGTIIDDNDIAEIDIGSEPGYIQLSDDFPLVYPGTLILIYDPDGFVVDQSNDGTPNSSGNYQIPFSSSLVEIHEVNLFPYNNYGFSNSEGWNGYLPFRNFGDVAQIKSPDGSIIHALAWDTEDYFWLSNNTQYQFVYPTESFYWKANMRNQSIQLTNGNYSDQSSYRISGYSSPGEPNTAENEQFIENLKNGLINNSTDFEVTILSNQTEGNQDASIKVSLTGTTQSNPDWTVEVDDQNFTPTESSQIIENLTGGTKTVLVEIWNETIEQYCPFEKTINIPIDEIEEEDLCPGECTKLHSEGQHCIAWLDKDGNLLSNDTDYEVCPEESTTITEIIENEQGLIEKRIIHNINIVEAEYSLETEIPNICPPTDIKLKVIGNNFTVVWDDGTSNAERIVHSDGTYNVTITYNESNCEFHESFNLSPDIFNDTDGDGVCDNYDCNPNDPYKKYAKGDPCNDGNPCTINDKFDDACNCVEKSTIA